MYEGDRVAGNRTQGPSDERAEGEANLLERMARFKQCLEFVITCESGWGKSMLRRQRDVTTPSMNPEYKNSKASPTVFKKRQRWKDEARDLQFLEPEMFESEGVRRSIDRRQVDVWESRVGRSL